MSEATNAHYRLVTPKQMPQLDARIPIGRLARVEEIAAAAAFLASDEAAYFTAAESPHDGGASNSAIWRR